MPTLPQFILTLICLLIPHTTTARNQICGRTSCGNGPSIQFPFRLREANQSDRCGYPGFELSCNNRNQTLLTLPYAGDFEVKAISRTDQKVWINDPNNCLPQRFLHNMDLTAGSSFRFSETYSVVNLTFLNCSSNVTELTPLEPIYCLTSINNDNYSVMAIESDPPYSTEWISSCQVISTALVPFSDMTRWLFFTGLLADVELQWSQPDCRDCEKHGGRCGLSGDTGLEVACNLQDQGEGVSRNAKYGIALGLGIPGGLFIIGMVWLFSRKLINSEGRQHQESIESRIVQLPVVSVGLGRETIEKYPKTELGESGRLPNPDDNVCSICLCEYQPKETLRTIPECNHYFHLNCIDGWLKMNATCPLCRNLPETESLSLGTLSRSSTSSGS